MGLELASKTPTGVAGSAKAQGMVGAVDQVAPSWRSAAPRLSLGLYEKALPAALAWPERLRAAAQAGFEFVEISVDDSDGRIARLDWSPRERAALREAALETGVPIKSMSLSAHRRYPLGSASAATRQTGSNILAKAIDFCVETGIRYILVAGIDVYHEPSDAQTEAHFLMGLERGFELASAAGVMLALENWDIGINSLRRARQYVDYFNSPWFQLYVDVGNLAYAGYDVVAELEASRGHIAAVHFKDTLKGQLRYVPLGEGEVPFVAACAKLAELGFQGPAVVELWTEALPNALEIVTHANGWLRERIAEGWRHYLSQPRTEGGLS